MAEAMDRIPRMLILGEGVADPKGIFGTTLLARRRFPERVIETPLSETMLTGACLGLALEGWTPVYVHARCDFTMLGMEHMVNTIAKWGSVHGNRPLNLVVRALIGRGWGQGPNHSQALHAMFAHVPGLRVLYPVLPQNVPIWIQDALTCGRPTIILEPRRLYEVEEVDYPTWTDPDVYLVTFGDVVLDAALVARLLAEQGVRAQVHPIEDVSALVLPDSGAPVVVADTGHIPFGAAAEVSARLAERGNTRVKRIGPPFTPLPTSQPLEQQWYPSPEGIIMAVGELLGSDLAIPSPATPIDDGFKGPF